MEQELRSKLKVHGSYPGRGQNKSNDTNKTELTDRPKPRPRPRINLVLPAQVLDDD